MQMRSTQSYFKNPRFSQHIKAILSTCNDEWGKEISFTCPMFKSSRTARGPSFQKCVFRKSA